MIRLDMVSTVDIGGYWKKMDVTSGHVGHKFPKRKLCISLDLLRSL